MNTLFLTQFKLAGTKPLRLSATKYLGKFGGNAQNQDKESLRIYRARPGCLFVQADEAGADALIVAHMARDGRLRQLFENGIKPHSYVAGHIFPQQFPRFKKEWYLISPAELVKDLEWSSAAKLIKNSPYQYGLGKQTVHARNYKMGWKTFRDNVLKETRGAVVLTAAQAKYFLDVFDVLFPEVLELHDVIAEKVLRTRQLENLFGYQRRFEQKITDAYIRDAISWVPASTVACIVHLAVIAMQNRIENERLPWNVINQKHDSYLTEVPEADGMKVASYMQQSLRAKLIGWDGIEFYMGSEVSIGRNWGKYDEEKNPDGMKEVKL